MLDWLTTFSKLFSSSESVGNSSHLHQVKFVVFLHELSRTFLFLGTSAKLEKQLQLLSTSRSLKILSFSKSLKMPIAVQNFGRWKKRSFAGNSYSGRLKRCFVTFN